MWLLFLALFGGILGLFAWFEPLVEPGVNAWTAQVAAAALRGFGVDARADGATVENPLQPIEVIWECTGLTAVALFVAAVVASPAWWRRKLAAVCLGVPVILLVNTLRLVSLVFVGHFRPELFEIAHVVVWQALMVLAAVSLWLVWLERLGGRPRPGGRRA